MQTYIPPKVKDFLLSFFPLEKRAQVREVVEEVEELYRGKWAAFEPCDIPYHDLRHAWKVAQTTLILLEGRERAGVEKIPGEYRFLALIGALFHDSGYLKERGDEEGSGAKHTFDHVARSVQIAEEYMQGRGLSPWERKVVREAIALTDLGKRPPPAQTEVLSHTIAATVSTADLLVQVSAYNYLERLQDLFAEFSEAYRWVGVDRLRSQGVRIYSSYEELLQDSADFFRKQVFSRFKALGNVERYASFYFPAGRNFFLESLCHNFALLLRYAQEGTPAPSLREPSLWKEKTSPVSELKIDYSTAERVLRDLQREITCERITLFALDFPYLSPVVCLDVDLGGFQGRRIPVEESLLGEVWARKEPVLIRDLTVPGENEAEICPFFPSILAIPLVREKVFWGILEMFDKKLIFDKRDCEKILSWGEKLNESVILKEEGAFGFFGDL